MDETKLLNKTLELLSDEGALKAYDFLKENKDNLKSVSGQVYNFLYCLAAVSDKREEALDWLEEAIITKGLWYRPEVFEDEDLDSIRGDKRFEDCLVKSNMRYLEALKNTKTVCTWTENQSDKLVFSLHGNQQNNEINKLHWDFLKQVGYQVEYLQSEEIDSYQLFRWEDKGSGGNQLHEAIKSIDWDSYQEKILCGFSAGCNVILTALRDFEFKCDRIILQSPWIPIVEENITDLIQQLKVKDIEVIIICGKDDEDSMPQCELFEKTALEMALDIKVVYIENLGHDYPENFNEIIFDILTT